MVFLRNLLSFGCHSAVASAGNDTEGTKVSLRNLPSFGDLAIALPP